MRERALNGVFTALLVISVMQLMLGLLSLPAYVARVSTLTIEPFRIDRDVQFSNAIVAASFFNPLGDAYEQEWTLLTSALLSLTIGSAILRYRLFDIDIIIRRTLVYAVLSFTLGAVYLVSVVGLQALFVRLTGQESTVAVVASTLGIVALFQPLRRHVQALIDRRFFRRKYDARLVLEQFARRAQQEPDLDALSADVLATVQEALEPDGVRLWLT